MPIRETLYPHVWPIYIDGSHVNARPMCCIFRLSSTCFNRFQNTKRLELARKSTHTRTHTWPDMFIHLYCNPTPIHTWSGWQTIRFTENSWRKTHNAQPEKGAETETVLAVFPHTCGQCVPHPLPATPTSPM